MYAVRHNSGAVERTVVGTVLYHPSPLALEEARHLPVTAETEGERHTLALLVGMKTVLVLAGAVELIL